MNYPERLQNVSVLGAAGKMGSGILLLTAIEMANQSLKPENKEINFVINAMDVSSTGLKGLMSYIRGQVLKIAEKKTVELRKIYAERTDLIENSEIINQYIEDVMNIIRPTTRIESSYDSTLIFEAIKEDPTLKVKIFKQINQNNKNNPWFYTNTSSIPISLIDKEAGLDGRILGVHFYNPPAVQKLVEVIKGKNTKEELHTFALEFIKNLRKIAVPSNDFAGFIGNGHFMRDAQYGIQEVEKLTQEMPFVEAVYTINKVTQDYLVRPMGIFQLIDYVGIEVCSYIMSVMNPYLENEDLHCDILDKMIELGVMGGQYSSGAQKDGFLKYEKGNPVAIYDIDKKGYIAIENIQEKCDQRLGKLPENAVQWKSVIRRKDKDDVLAAFFNQLKDMDTFGAKLAISYGQKSCEIGKQLVNDNVAFTEEDVNTVMLTGFFHAYGPINNYFNH